MDLGRWGIRGRKKPKLATLLPDHTTYRLTVITIVVVGGVNIGAIEVGVVGVRRTVDRTGPIVGVVTAIVQRAAIDVASADKDLAWTFRVARCHLYRINDVWTFGSDFLNSDF